MTASDKPFWKTCLVNQELKLIYAYVPKVACTSIKTWLVEHADFAPGLTAAIAAARASSRRPGEPGYPEMHRYLDDHCTLQQLPPATAQAILADPAYFKFTFVRHPLTRLVSAYLDKIVLVKPPAWRIIRSHQFWRGRLGWNHVQDWWRGKPFLDRERSLSFREFVSQLGRENPHKVDFHFRAQARLLQGIQLDFVGHFENLGADFAVIQQQLRQFAPLPTRHMRGYAADRAAACVADWDAARFRQLSAAPTWQCFFDAELLRAAGMLYASDFSRFGYVCESRTQAIAATAA